MVDKNGKCKAAARKKIRIQRTLQRRPFRTTNLPSLGSYSPTLASFPYMYISLFQDVVSSFPVGAHLCLCLYPCLCHVCPLFLVVNQNRYQTREMNKLSKWPIGLSNHSTADTTISISCCIKTTNVQSQPDDRKWKDHANSKCGVE